MVQVGTTAVLAVLPDAEPLLELAAGVDGRAVRPGVPAHAALLYPWLPADEIGEEELRRLRDALPAGRVPVRLATVERAGGFVGVPVPGLDRLAEAVRSAFPAHVPYGGRFGPRPPVHLTVALDVAPEAAAEIACRTGAALPITTEVGMLHAVALTPTGWRGLAELPLTRRRGGATTADAGPPATLSRDRTRCPRRPAS
ncbi:2'-5' RNA ligase family protein [Streptomyces sp. NPDC048392]|uniref:2'-5' RNA ligase family protein n=1 Tax=Streptomyces sp. NPDC048392 TaxID=3365543 RepID=UPI00371B13B5